MRPPWLTRVLCLLLGLALSPTRANGMDLQAEPDPWVADLLANAEPLIEQDMYGLFVRIYRLRDNPSTCTGLINPCPGEQIFVAVKPNLCTKCNFKPKVFLLPRALGWRNPYFENDNEFGRFSPFHLDHFIRLSLEEVVRGEYGRGGLETRKRLCYFNAHQAHLSPIPGEAP
ncbi:MAG: hypothetical protein H7836_13975 [Magnetococcus sp. YQC-3]